MTSTCSRACRQSVAEWNFRLFRRLKAMGLRACAMPFSKYAEDPLRIEAMCATFHRVCDVLRLDCGTDDPMTEAIARQVGVLMGRSDHADIVDVAVFEGAIRRKDAVVTSDAGHICHIDQGGGRPASH